MFGNPQKSDGWTPWAYQILCPACWSRSALPPWKNRCRRACNSSYKKLAMAQCWKCGPHIRFFLKARPWLRGTPRNARVDNALHQRASDKGNGPLHKCNINQSRILSDCTFRSTAGSTTETSDWFWLDNCGSATKNVWFKNYKCLVRQLELSGSTTKDVWFEPE